MTSTSQLVAQGAGPDDYYSDRYRELNRQLAKRERSTKRKGRESLAARGALHSGMTSTVEREIEGQMGEEFTRGARDIEDRRWRAEQDEIARTHQTGERVGSQEWASGESEAERNVRMKLQQMADAERFRLQELVNTGQMDLQDADQKWTSYENDLNRQLEEWTTSGQWGHEAGMQAETIAQEQWSAMFGAESAMALQNDTQSFEEFMAGLGRKWELADRPWQEQMWYMDAQLQMLVAGYDWLDDPYSGGMPSWMVATPDEGTAISSGTVYTQHPGGAGPGWTLNPNEGGGTGGGGTGGGGGLTPEQQAAYNNLPPGLQAQWSALSPEQQQYYLDRYANF